MIFQTVFTVFQIILCRFVPSQFLLIIFTQLYLKSFVKYAKKIVPNSRVRKFIGNKISLEVQHINLCHPDYHDWMWTRRLFSKKNCYKVRGGVGYTGLSFTCIRLIRVHHLCLALPCGPSFEQTWIPVYPRILGLSLVDIGPVVLEKM